MDFIEIQSFESYNIIIPGKRRDQIHIRQNRWNNNIKFMIQSSEIR